MLIYELIRENWTSIVAITQSLYGIYNFRVPLMTLSSLLRKSIGKESYPFVDTDYTEEIYKQFCQERSIENGIFQPQANVILPVFDEEPVLDHLIDRVQEIDYSNKTSIIVTSSNDNSNTPKLACNLAKRKRGSHINVPPNNDLSWDEIWKWWEDLYETKFSLNKRNEERILDLPWLPKYRKSRDLPYIKPRDVTYSLYQVIKKEREKYGDDSPLFEQQFAVIFDAEDIPNTDMLKRMDYGLNKKLKSNGVIQARLIFSDKNLSNFLKRHASGDYGSHFKYMLPLTYSSGLPILLAGTSYGVPLKIYHRTGGLDPSNITEDAMYGMLLNSLKIPVKLIDTETIEQPPGEFAKFEISSLKVDGKGRWLGQRTRWVKGFFDTLETVLRSKTYTISDKLKSIIMLAYSPFYPIINTALFPFSILEFVGSKVLNLPELNEPLRTMNYINLTLFTYYLSMAVRGFNYASGRHMDTHKISDDDTSFSNRVKSTILNGLNRLYWNSIYVAGLPFLYWPLTGIPSANGLLKKCIERREEQVSWSKTIHESYEE